MTPFGSFHHRIHEYKDYQPSSVTSSVGTGGGSGRSSSCGMPSFLFGSDQNDHKLLVGSSALNTNFSFLSSTSSKPLSGSFGAVSDTGITHQLFTSGAAPSPYDGVVGSSVMASPDNVACMDDDSFGMDLFLEGAQGFQDCGGGTDKKGRRLGFQQVKALEKAFEIDNRLEPDRKLRLAADLGLQPRQLAVWFQNRRARWKTKQMERDYNVLKSKFETLKADRDKLLVEREKLQLELKRLQSNDESPANGQSGERLSPATFTSFMADASGVLQPTELLGEKPISAIADLIGNPEIEAFSRDEATADGSILIKKINMMENVMMNRHNESLTSSTDEYNSDDGGAMVDSATSNTSLNTEDDQATNLTTAYKEELDLYTNHWMLSAKPLQAIEDIKPTAPPAPITKPETIWEEDDLPSSNSIQLNLLAHEWYNW